MGTRVSRGVVERARLLYAMGVFGDGEGGVRLRPGEYRDPVCGLALGDVRESSRVRGGRSSELRRIAEWVGVGEEDVREWYERSEPDGVGWDDVRERWSGGLVRLDWGEEGEVDVRLRALAGCEAIMAAALSAMRNVELYDETGKRVEVLYTRAGVPVSVGGLRPSTYREAQAAYLAAAKLAGEQAEALSKRASFEELKRRIKVELAAYFARKLELTEEQKARLTEAVERADEEVGMVALDGVGDAR